MNEFTHVLLVSVIMKLVMTAVPPIHPISFSLPVSTLPNGRVETSTVIKQHSTELRGSGGGAQLSFFFS